MGRMGKFRFGVLIGFAGGYVLGSKAGRERYHQIEAMWRKAMRSEPAQQLQAEMRQTAETVGDMAAQKASQGVAAASQTLEEARGKVEQAAGNIGGSGRP